MVGHRLVPLLLAAGHHVVGMTRNAASASGLHALGAEPVIADALDRERVAEVVAMARPDVVMHQLTDLSGGTSATNARLRTEGTRDLVDAALAAGVRRIVAQSIAWAYAPGSEPAEEPTALDTCAPEPRRTTIGGIEALESAVREAPEWVVLRYGLLYGAGTWYASDGLRAEQARAGKLTADADISSFVHVDDAATAAVARARMAVRRGQRLDDDPAPGWEWVPAFCAAVGADPPPTATGERAAWARGASNRHARRGPRWVPRHPTWRSGSSSTRFGSVITSTIAGPL